jgi:uncharacterized protein YggU (UPF0235/DUF167 family)|tara:strand:- start:7085 stop:7270 length:186 start_codon:yes stop_codon:yes gene_type:complete
MILRIKALPDASQSRVVGMEIRLFAAQLLIISKSKVILTKGISSRIKTIETSDATAILEGL